VAIDNESVEVVRVLVEHSADIHAKGVDNLAALQYAMKWCVSRDPTVGCCIKQENHDAGSKVSSPWSFV